MLVFLQKPRNLDEIAYAVTKGNVYQQTAKQKKTEPELPAEKLQKALLRHISWSGDARHQLLTFLRLFKCRISVTSDRFVAKDSKKRVEIAPEAPSAKTQAAREALQKHGTPMRLLELFYKKLNVRLVIFSGATCRYVHTPDDWDSRGKDDKHTVVLNVWSNHVFTYDRETHNRTFQAHSRKAIPEIALITLRDNDERYNYENMLPLNWALVLQTIQECVRGTVFWTTSEMNEDFFKPLEDMDVTFTPFWPTPAACTGIFIPIGDKKKAGIRIKRVPDEHRALHAFCQSVQEQLHLKLTYCGESKAVLGHKFIQLLLV